MNNEQGIAKEITDAILAEKDTKPTRAMRRHPWETIDRGIQFAKGVNDACVELFNSSRMNQSQKGLRDLYIRRIRETSLRLTPEQLIEICGKAYPMGFIGMLVAMAFGTKRHQIDEAVKLIHLITEAKSLMPPFAGEMESDDLIDESIGLALIFGCLVEQSFQEIDYTWSNFLEATIQEDPRAMESWRIIAHTHAITHGFSWIEASQTQGMIQYDMTSTSVTIPNEIIKYLSGDPDGCLPLPIPDHLYANVFPILEKLSQGMNDDHERLSQTIDWFHGNRESLHSLEQIMWEDIVERPRNGLRNAGDRIALDFPALHEGWYQHQSFILSPLAPFPMAQVKYLISYMGNPVSRTFTFAPNHFSCNESPGWDSATVANQIVDELLHFIALHSYWTIVMGRSEPRESPNTSDTSERMESNRKRLRTAITPVRSHFRPLPEGRQASQSAAEQAQEALGQLPPGKTFVGEYERGWGPEEDLAPVFTYKEDDLKSWI